MDENRSETLQSTDGSHRLRHEKMSRLAIFCFAVALPNLSEARIGESLGQCERRYGKSQEDRLAMAFPILEGAQHRIYQYDGWAIRVAFVKGIAVRQEYSKVGSKNGPQIKDFEAAAILEGEKGSGTWEAKGKAGILAGITGNAKRAAMGFVWQRSDGALAMLRPSELILRVETADAAKIEAELKQGRETGQRKRVPKF